MVLAPGWITYGMGGIPLTQTGRPAWCSGDSRCWRTASCPPRRRRSSEEVYIMLSASSSLCFWSVFMVSWRISAGRLGVKPACSQATAERYAWTAWNMFDSICCSNKRVRMMTASSRLFSSGTDSTLSRHFGLQREVSRMKVH